APELCCSVGVGAVAVGKVLFSQNFIELTTFDDGMLPVLNQFGDQKIVNSFSDILISTEDRIDTVLPCRIQSSSRQHVSSVEWSKVGINRTKGSARQNQRGRVLQNTCCVKSCPRVILLGAILANPATICYLQGCTTVSVLWFCHCL